MAQIERDFPLGHPMAVDTVPGSPEHLAWLRVNDKSRGERDFPFDHPKAVDTLGNENHMPTVAGVDPHNQNLEVFTGRNAEQAAAAAEFAREASAHAKESQSLPPIDADVANAALEAKRKELGVDALTAEQHMEVLAGIQNSPAPAAPRVAAIKKPWWA